MDQKRIYQLLTHGFLIVFATIASVACSSPTPKDKETKSVNHIDTSTLVNKKQESAYQYKATVTSIDSTDFGIQRLFVAMDIRDTTYMQDIICDIYESYFLASNGNISFFTDEKYANYKDLLFVVKDHSLPMEEYENWLKEYYIAEYSSKDGELIYYPASSPRKVVQIEPCIGNKKVGTKN